eukprot:1031644-Pyramimonas_sp.AAC.1
MENRANGKRQLTVSLACIGPERIVAEHSPLTSKAKPRMRDLNECTAMNKNETKKCPAADDSGTTQNGQDGGEGGGSAALADACRQRLERETTCEVCGFCEIAVAGGDGLKWIE